MADRYLDFSPREALELARSEADWEYLERYLRSRVVAYLQNREGDSGELRSAVLGAVQWARSEDREPWATIWHYMLQILQDADRLPALAEDLRTVRRPEGRAAQVLSVLAEAGRPMRPKEVAARLGIGSSHMTNLGRDLEKARLIVRQKAGGRATWLFATARGLRLAASWPGLRPEVRSRTELDESNQAPETSTWNESAMAEGPEIKVA